MKLPGIASDDLAAVLATGTTDVDRIFVSMTAREPNGRDADYLEWHSLDHRPEQYRIAGLRHSLRLVSTPACRALRAHSDARYDGVDHVMTYFFAAQAAFDDFTALSAALGGDRRPFRLSALLAGYFKLAGKIAARRAIAGADVIPWRPSRGAYVLVEERAQSPAELADIEGVAGVWWHRGDASTGPSSADHAGIQVTYCFIDDEPTATAERLRRPLERRWAAGAAVPVLAAPFHTLVPFEWDRYLP